MKYLLPAILLLFPALALADTLGGADTLHCRPTPEMAGDDHYPGHDAIVPAGNLALPAGKAVYPAGQRLFLTGRVLDQNCVPISEAIVEIWQSDPYGESVRSSLNDRLRVAPHFTGSGRAVTDNLGRFHFVTLFPGTRDSRAPFIHVRVAKRGFPTLSTEMLFAADRRNDADQTLRRLSPEYRDLVTANVAPHAAPDTPDAINAEWNVVLRGHDPFRHF